MLRGARIEASWIQPPTPEAIRTADRERLLVKLLAPVEVDEEDQALAERLLSEKTPAEIAAALVHAHRSALPPPEELIAAEQRAERRPPRDDFGPSAWFRLDIGRRQNADPRWLLPLLCRRGHVSKDEIGAIRIGPNETQFEVRGDVAARFAQALGRTAGTDDSGIAIEPIDGAPSGPSRSNDGPRHQARPTGQRPTGPRGPRTGQPHRGAPRGAPGRSGPR
jgi:ATP-dependent RNA helicase DeaD